MRRQTPTVKGERRRDTDTDREPRKPARKLEIGLVFYWVSALNITEKTKNKLKEFFQFFMFLESKLLRKLFINTVGLRSTVFLA